MRAKTKQTLLETATAHREADKAAGRTWETAGCSCGSCMLVRRDNSLFRQVASAFQSQTLAIMSVATS